MAAQAEKLCESAATVLRKCNQGEGVRDVLYSTNVHPNLRPQLQAIVLGVQKEEVRNVTTPYMSSQQSSLLLA